MPAIKAKVTERPRVVKRCAQCDDVLRPNILRIEATGHAFRRDPLTTLYFCMQCAFRSTDKLLWKTANRYLDSHPLPAPLIY